MRWSTPGMRRSWTELKSKSTAELMRPKAKMTNDRRRICQIMAPVRSPRWRRRPREMVSETPMMTRKEGKTRSAGVQPCQGACAAHGKTSSDPLELTTIIPAIVRPRKTSSERRRWFSLFAIQGLLDELAVLLGQDLDLVAGLFQAAGQALGQRHALLEEAQAVFQALVARLKLAHQVLQLLERALERLLLSGLAHFSPRRSTLPREASKAACRRPPLAWTT